MTISDADISEPYTWVPSNLLDVVAFVNHIRGLVDQTGTLTLRGEGEAVADHAVNAGDAAMAFAVPEPTVTRTEPDDHAVNAGDSAHAWAIPQPTTTSTAPDDHAVNAGDASVAWAILAVTVTLATAQTSEHAVNAGDAAAAWAIPQPTVTRTAAPGALLVLSDFDTTGLDTEFAALITIAQTPPTLYADSDRGGTDTPTDGELGLGVGQTVISRIVRQETAGVVRLTLNDEDNPVALDLDVYFGAGGDGRDLTLHLQTLEGTVAIVVATATIRASGGGFVQFEITAEQAAIIDALATGDRFILAGTRPTPTTVDHAADAGDVALEFAVPEPTVTLTAAVSGVSVFDASIVPGWTDVANATPGVVWAFERTTHDVNRQEWLQSFEFTNEATQRIPPSHIEGVADAFVGGLFYGAAPGRSVLFRLGLSASTTPSGVVHNSQTRPNPI